MKSFGNDLDEKQLLSIIRRIDTDSDAKITLEELNYFFEQTK